MELRGLLLRSVILLALLSVWSVNSLCAVENVLRPRAAVRSAAVRKTQYLEEAPSIEEMLSSEDQLDPDCGGEEFTQPEPWHPGEWHHTHRRCATPPGELLWMERIHRAWQGHRDPNDPLRHFGVGEPLMGTSWRNRPWYVGAFAGGIIGDELQSGLVDQGGGFFAGGRFGGDFDHFWGCEVRFAFSDLNVHYPGVVASGQSNDTFFDANLLYYPLGDTRWRPYLSLGFGMAGFKYNDALGKQIHASGIGIPFGGGLKYLLSRHWAMRFDITDNITFDAGSHADSMHNVTFAGGMEFHFGGRTVSYGPW